MQGATSHAASARMERVDVPGSPEGFLDAPRTILLSGKQIIFGRNKKKCDVVLRGGAQKVISRQHATIHRRQDKRTGKFVWSIEDLQSTNGIFINQTKVQESELSDGDLIHLSGGAGLPVGQHIPNPSFICFKFRIDGPPAVDLEVQLNGEKSASAREKHKGKSGGLQTQRPALKEGVKDGQRGSAEKALPVQRGESLHDPAGSIQSPRRSLRSPSTKPIYVAPDEDSIPEVSPPKKTAKTATEGKADNPPPTKRKRGRPPKTRTDSTVASPASATNRAGSSPQVITPSTNINDKRRKRSRSVSLASESEQRNKERYTPPPPGKRKRGRPPKRQISTEETPAILQGKTAQELPKGALTSEDATNLTESDKQRKKSSSPDITSEQKEHEKLCERVPEAANGEKHVALSILLPELSCSVCQDLMLDAAVLPCSHGFCFICISEQLKKTGKCPICRQPFDTAPYRSSHLDHIVTLLSQFLPPQKKESWDKRVKAHHVKLEILQTEVPEVGAGDVSSDDEPITRGPEDECGTAEDVDDEGDQSRCESCNEIGHTYDDCPYRSEREEKSSSEEEEDGNSDEDGSGDESD